jgi:hypothetical protein
MQTEEVSSFLQKLDRRLATLADQVQEIRAQAQHALDRLNLTRRELELFRTGLRSDDDTVHDCHAPVPGQQG